MTKNLLKLELTKNIRSKCLLICSCIIAIIIVASFFLFSPTPINNNNEYSIEASTVNELYTEYNTSINSSTTQSIAQAQSMLEYYTKLNNRQESIIQLSTQIKSDFELLEAYKNAGENTTLNNQAKLITTNLNTFAESLTSFGDLVSIDYIYEISVNASFTNDVYFNKVRQLASACEEQISSNNSSRGINVYNLLVNNKLQNLLDDCASRSINFVNYTIGLYYDNIVESYYSYRNYMDSTTSRYFSVTQANNLYSSFTANLDQFISFYSKLNQFDYKMILCKKKIVTTLENKLNALQELTLESNTRQAHLSLIESINKINFLTAFENFVDHFTIISLSNEQVKSINSYIPIANNNLTVIKNEIEMAHSHNNFEQLKTGIINQIELKNSVVELINNSISLACYQNFSVYSDYIDESEIYNSRSIVTLAKYNIDTNTYTNTDSNLYQFNYQVNSDISVLDYAQFVIKLASAIIVIFMAIMISNTIAGENYNGTLKLIIMSPNKRNKIWKTKFWSIIIVNSLLLVLTYLISLAIGLIKFGLPTSNIVTIFNANSVITLSPIIASIILLLCQIVAIVGYASLLFLVSSIFKKYSSSIIATISTSLGIYGLSKIKLIYMTALPSNNFNLAKYFYTNNYNTNNNILHALFDTTSYSIQNFYISLIYMILSIIIINNISRLIFRKQSY